MRSTPLLRLLAEDSGLVKKGHPVNSETAWRHSVSPQTLHHVRICDKGQHVDNAQQQRSRALLAPDLDMEQEREPHRP